MRFKISGVQGQIRPAILLGLMAVPASGVTGTAFSQQNDSGAASVDAADWLLKAAQVNGLKGPDLKPWHIKISIESRDPQDFQGTFEELWAGPDRYKRVIAAGTFKQVEYTTAAGVRRTGDPDGAPEELTAIVNLFLDPIGWDAAAIRSKKLEMSTPTMGDAKYVCITAPRKITAVLLVSNDTYCTTERSAALRLETFDNGVTRVIRNDIVRFQDRYLPQKVEEFNRSAQEPLMTAKVDVVEALDSVDEAMFTPPADAVEAPKLISLLERETKSHLVHHSFPQYDSMLPGENRSVHLAKMVVIALRVRTDGRVSDVRALSGATSMWKVSEDAVKKWTYKPFIQDGKPVEVNTTATLVYSLTN